MLRGKINKVSFEEVKQLKNKKRDANALSQQQLKKKKKTLSQLDCDNQLKLEASINHPLQKNKGNKHYAGDKVFKS